MIEPPIGQAAARTCIWRAQSAGATHLGASTALAIERLRWPPHSGPQPQIAKSSSHAPAMLQPCIWAPPLWFERLQGPTSGPQMLMICGDEVLHRMESNRLWQSRMDEPWPGLSLAAGGRERTGITAQHGCKVPCSHPGPALAQRPDRQRGTTDATVKGAASRGKRRAPVARRSTRANGAGVSVGAVAAPYRTHLQMLLRARHDMGYGVDAVQVKSSSTPRCLWKL